MKTIKKKLAIMAFGVVSLFAVSCAAKKNPALPLDVTYQITSIGDYKITEGQKPDVNFAKDGRFFGMQPLFRTVYAGRAEYKNCRKYGHDTDVLPRQGRAGT